MKLAVLTSGGDSAGMNAAVRAVVKAGILKYVSSLFLE
jgi:6-phosphofructokinase 1